jgi:hypothetical protein
MIDDETATVAADAGRNTVGMAATSKLIAAIWYSMRPSL